MLGDKRPGARYEVRLQGVNIGEVEKWSFSVWDRNGKRIIQRPIKWRCVNDRNVRIGVRDSRDEVVSALINAAKPVPVERD